jgi:hypothetical protein
VFIASSTGSEQIAFDGETDTSLHTGAQRSHHGMGEKLEDVFRAFTARGRLSTGEAQIPGIHVARTRFLSFTGTPPSPAEQLFAAASETGNLALYDLLIDRFPASAEAAAARPIVDKLRQAAASEPPAASAALVLARARQARTPEAYDLVASLFPDTTEAEEARAAASRLREATVLDSAGPTHEGRELVTLIQQQLARLDCRTGEPNGVFETSTIQGLRRASLLSDERYLWYRPTMAALRALRKIDANDGCGRQKTVTAPRCLRINNEDYCQ